MKQDEQEEQERMIRLRAPTEERPPVVELDDVGIYFHLHRRSRINLRQAILRRQWIHRPDVLWALRHLNLTLHEGQVLGIIGPNGAGKSTLCLILSQILPPDEGKVVVRGKVSQLVSMGTGFNNDLSGRANVRLYSAYLGIKRGELDAMIEEIVDFSELGDFIDEPLRHYSGGMRARLGFSVASTLNPEILVLDEVFSVGDAKFRGKATMKLVHMMNRCKLIAIVSHSTDFLRALCTHCLWLERGQLHRYGKAADVLAEYDEVMGESSAEMGTEMEAGVVAAPDMGPDFDTM
jgi:ABC-type polysaccharide/polyol phosphate transport system ATPase subunit